MPIYCFSTNEERFNDHCESADIESARKIAEAELCLEEGQAYYVGLRKDVHPELKLNASRLLEDIGEAIYEDVGDICEDWPDVTAIQVAELERRLQATFFAWMQEVNCNPKFWQVVDTRKFDGRVE